MRNSRLVLGVLLAVGLNAAAEEAPKPKPARAVRIAEDVKPILHQAGYKIYARWPIDAKEAQRRQQETAQALGIPVEKTVTLPHETPMKFVLIPAGDFVMGSPQTELGRRDDEAQHLVRITTPYYLGKYEFGQQEWVTGRMRDGKFARNRSYQGDPKRPVEQASWKDAQITLAYLNRLELGLFTLPTEAEWEFACRGGTNSPFYFGDTISTDQANYDGNTIYGEGKKGVFRLKTTQRGIFPANAYGLHDMHGNVWEWCWDVYDKDAYNRGAQVNPTGPQEGPRHVVRGGAFAIFGVDDVRSAARRSYLTERRGRCVGFRIVLRTLKPKTAEAAEK